MFLFSSIHAESFQSRYLVIHINQHFLARQPNPCVTSRQCTTTVQVCTRKVRKSTYLRLFIPLLLRIKQIRREAGWIILIFKSNLTLNVYLVIHLLYQGIHLSSPFFQTNSPQKLFRPNINRFP